ncbi:MAG: formylglycine-generating enzyme family protein, partial [bacterium]|nr:formylglycine-generating enzyme family protein [bacterium]
IIQLTAYVSGEVFIDGVFVEKIESGDSRQYRDIRTGTHKVEIRKGTQIYGQNVIVMKGQVNCVTIQPPRIEPIPQQPTIVTPPTEKSIKGMTLVLIPGGTFDMGDTFGDGADDEKPVHSVTVSDFYIGKTEVTVAQYREFCRATNRNMPEAPSCGWQDIHPIVNISWLDAAAYCQWAGCRLPTEAEWEYAAREGGKKIKWSGTSTENLIGDYAWYSGNSGSKTHPVGTKKPNALGLYDMSGNVWEWCSDWYDENYYKNSPRNNPKGPAAGTYRLLRGGSWDSDEWFCRSSNRDRNYPGDGYGNVGFRVALDSPQ